MVGFWDGVGRVRALRGRCWDRVLTTTSITATPRASLGHTKLNPPDTDAVGIRGVVPPSAHAERALGSAQGPHTVLTQGRPMHGHPLHGHAPVLGFCENSVLEVINREERRTGTHLPRFCSVTTSTRWNGPNQARLKRHGDGVQGIG